MSRLVSRRTRSARSVRQSAATHADSVGARLDAEFAAAGVAAPPMDEVIKGLGRIIGARSDAMERADRAHEEELSDDAEPRHARDVAYADLAESFANLRDVIGVVGSAALVKRLGLSGRTPRTPDELLQAARIVRGRLAQIAIPQAPGLAVDAPALAGRLDADIAALEQALTEVDREAREAEATLQAKHEAMAAYDQAFSGAAAALSALFLLADEPDLARRVRPSQRRPGRTVDEDGEGEGDGAEAAGGAPGDGADPPADRPVLRPLPTGGDDD